MANGRLAKSNPAAETGTLVYTVPAGYYASISVNIMNSSGSAGQYNLAILNSGDTTPVLSDYIEYQMIVEPTNVVERVGLVLSAGQSVYIYSLTSSLLVNVYGYETQV